MKFGSYIWNKKILIFGTLFTIVSIYMMGFAFKADRQYQNAIVFVVVTVMTVGLLWDFLKRRSFYNKMLSVLEQLDEKYLIAEMVKKPDFADGKILMEVLYETDKAMLERINKLELSVREFTEYLEMWIHEVKVPLSSLELMNYNESRDFAGQKKQIDRLKQYVEQILFYARADVSEKDYVMKRCRLSDIVNKVIREQKDLIIGNHISIEKGELDREVITDGKWLEFMLGQIVNNSIKYLIVKQESSSEQSIISFRLEKTDTSISIFIRDNGIGINSKDLPRVFDKSFTGDNGRKTTASTGMGLYICKKLCDKLGHSIEIDSREGEYTEIKISFGINKYYEFE